MPPARSANTCMQCRTRKVKCKSVGQGASCSDCERLAFDCSFAERSSPLSSSPRQPEKRRQSSACLTCRSNRIKCSGDVPSCSSCVERARHCVYPESRRRSRASPRKGTTSLDGSAPSREEQQKNQAQPEHSSRLSDRATATPTATATATATEDAADADLTTCAAGRIRSHDDFSASDAASVANRRPLAPELSGYGIRLPPLSEQLRLVNDFFRYLHALPSSSFLNEVSVTQRCLAGTLDEALLLAVCSITATTLKYPKYYPGCSSLWMRRVEEIVFQHLEEPTIIRTQALALLIQCYTRAGEFKRAYMFMAIAARFASALRLHYERVDCTPLAKEIRRRLLWALMIMDMSFSIGLRESETCSPDCIYLQLPCPEEQFHEDLEMGTEAPSSLDGIPEGGLLRLYIRQAIVRHDVMRLMRQVNIQTRPMPELQRLGEDLVQAHNLIEPAPYSPAELQRYSRSRWLVRFILARLMWHQGMCDIYRTFLTGYREGAPSVVISGFSKAYISHAAVNCLSHAQHILSIIDDIDKYKIEVLVPPSEMGVCGYHASRLVLFLSKSPLIPGPQNISPDAAAHAASRTLSILQRLFTQSVLLEQTLKDLAATISAHREGAAHVPEGSSEEDQDDDAHVAQPVFSMAIRKHKRLSKHSALWNARFQDDAGDGLGSPARLTATNLSPSSLATQPEIQQPPSFTRATAATSSMTPADSRSSAVKTTDQPLGSGGLPSSEAEDMVAVADDFSFEPMDFGMWDTFGSWGWGTTAFAGSGSSEQI